DLELAERGELLPASLLVIASAAEQDNQWFRHHRVLPVLEHLAFAFAEVEVLFLAARRHLEEEVLQTLYVIVHHPLPVARDERVHVAFELVLRELVAVLEKRQQQTVLQEEQRGELRERTGFLDDTREICRRLQSKATAVCERPFAERLAVPSEVINHRREEELDFVVAVADFGKPAAPDGATVVRAVALLGHELTHGLFYVVGERLKARPAQVGRGDPAVANRHFVEWNATIGPNDRLIEDGVAHVLVDGVRVGTASDFGAVVPVVRDVAVGADVEVADSQTHIGVRRTCFNAPFRRDLHPREFGAHHGAAGEELLRSRPIDATLECLPDFLEGVALGHRELNEAIFPAQVARPVARILGNVIGLAVGCAGVLCRLGSGERFSCGHGATSPKWWRWKMKGPGACPGAAWSVPG